ncbi:MAG: efflux RND transporter periplasmic adaptor subunit [Pikeienuella sp.]
MRFRLRFLIGIILLAGGVGAGAFGVYLFAESKRGAGGSFARGGGPSERVFAVEAGTITPSTIRPEITAYGEIRSWRTLELRAANAGSLVELTDSFRDGAEVAEDELLFRINPDDYQSRLQDATAAVEEAEADLTEAEQAFEVAKQETKAAETQKNLRQSALKRQQDLLKRGVATAAVVEEAELAFASAEQTMAGRAQSELAAQIKIDRTRLKLKRAEISLTEAERQLEKTEHRAPFRGLLSDVTAVLGGLASQNEKLGVLIDPTALEAAFRVTNAQFARLLDEDGALKLTPLTVTLALDDQPLIAPGRIDRADAVIAAGETGRLVFAKLDLPPTTILRTGDFVTVRIVEPALDNVALLPSSAVTEQGDLLIIDNELRLSELRVRILRRTGDDVIVADAPEGARYVTERAPQLGKGVLVKVINDSVAQADEPEPALVSLTPAHAAKLIEFVENNDRMAAGAKQKILTLLEQGKAPQRFLDRIGSTL